jgi:hypothetical protein
MVTQFLANASLFEFLLKADRDIACAAQEKGCVHCDGPLDAAHYRRKPRGGPPGLKEEVLLRYSFCCRQEGCRRRLTPPSTRFFGASVYFSSVVILAVAMMGDMSTASFAKLSATYGIDRRTLKRWRVFFTATIASRPAWGLVTARFMPPLDASNYILSMLSRFSVDLTDIAHDALSRLLTFIYPLSQARCSSNRHYSLLA